MKTTLLTSLLSICLIMTAYSQTTFGLEQTINAATGANPYAIDSGDLNGDTFIDIVIGTDVGNTVEWYTNDGTGIFTKQTNITSALVNVEGIHIADLDGMNGNDIIATGFGNDKIVWFANDGSGGFGAETLIGTLDGAGQVITTDINNDGDLDIVAVGYNADKVVWFAGDGTGSFGTEQIIESGTDGPGIVSIADFDGDTDLDIVIGFTNAGTIEVYYNQYIESGTMTVSWIKDTNQVDSGNNFLFVVQFADIDDNGSLDIIKSDNGNASPGEIAWFNKEGDGTYTKTTIPTTINKPGIVIATDLNNDTFSDIIVSNGSTGSPDDIIWFESTGAGTYFTEATISLFSDHKQTFGVTIADFDGDTDFDVASVNYQDPELSWFENELIVLGLDDNLIDKISIYPNPTTNKLHFKGTSLSDNFNISVFDILGKKVIEKSININTPLDVSQLHTGIYIIRFDDYNSTFKFVKE